MTRVPSKPVLGIDIGTSWPTTGSALLMPQADSQAFLECRVGVLPEDGPFDAKSLAEAIHRAADTFGVVGVSLDGPQGWRDPQSMCVGVGRHSELSAGCPGKTGVVGKTYPGTYVNWVRLCIDVFDLLLAKSDVVLANEDVPKVPERGYLLSECFPTSTWRSSGLSPLPGHRRADASTVRAYAARLAQAYTLPAGALTDNHDHLQGVVAALVAACLAGGPGAPRRHGVPSWVCSNGSQASRVEGIIWDSALPDAKVTVDPVSAAARDDVNPVLLDDRVAAADVAEARGVQLFEALVREANAGRALGVSYRRFLELLYDAPFESIVGRRAYQNVVDNRSVIRLATHITEVAGGRKPVTRGDRTIDAGMDTFIWPQANGHARSPRAWMVGWAPIPYTRDQWLAIFPDGERRLVDKIP